MKPLRTSAFVVACLLAAGIVRGHEGHPVDADAARPLVEIEVREGYRYVTSNGIPDHTPGQFPNRHNPNTIAPQSYEFRVTVSPKVFETPQESRGVLFGVALNGVVFDPGTAEFWRDDPSLGWRMEAIGGPRDLGLDRSNAHVQPSGAYHYHALPLGLLEKLGGTNAKKPVLLGWAADGFPIYSPLLYADAKDPKSKLKVLKSSYRLKSGTRPSQPDAPGGKYDGAYTRDWEYVAGGGDLDECNGRFGVTPEFPNGTYYYVLTEEFPFVPRLFRGDADPSFRKHDGPPPNRGGGRPRPPQ